MSRKFNADVDTQREYYNCQYFNTSGTDQLARYEVQLLKPFFTDPDAWKLSINRASVPLSMPLTHNNIPFQQWQVGIQFNDGTNPPTNNIQYVQQYNPSQITEPANYNILGLIGLLGSTNAKGVILQTPYNNLNSITTSRETAYTYTYGNSGLAYDLKSGTNGTLYCTQGNSPDITMCDLTTGSIYTTVNAGADPITWICADPISGNFWILTQNTTTNIPTIRQYTRATNTTWTAGNTHTYPIAADISSISYTNNTIFVVINGSVVRSYNSTTLAQVATLTTNCNNLIQASSGYLAFEIANGDGMAFYSVNPTTNAVSPLYTIKPQPYDINHLYWFCGVDNSGNLCIGYPVGNQQYKLQFYDSKSGVFLNETNPLIANMFVRFITPSVATQSITLDSGAYDIYTIQGYLNQINAAYALAFNTLKTQIGSAFLPTEPPSVVFQASTKLFELVVEGQYTTVNNNGTNQYSVVMNQSMWNKFVFPSTDLSIGGVIYESMILQNYGSNAIQGNGSATLPQFIAITQNQSTIYAFNDLTRVIFATTQIPVSGDGDGVVFTNQGATANKTLNMITDIAPDTTSQLTGTRLIYIPNGILRWYNLYAQQPFSKIDMQVYYEMKDGQIFPLVIPNKEYFSVKLEFKKGSGDF